MKLRIKGKLLAGFSFSIAISLILSFFGILELSKIEAADKKMYQTSVQALVYLGRMNEDINRVQWRLRDLMLTNDEALNLKYKTEIETLRKGLDDSTAALTGLVSSNEGKKTPKAL